jgi:hypothetical protein
MSGDTRDFLPGEPEDEDPSALTPEGLLQLLDAQADLLVTVATGQREKIDAPINHRYERRRRKLNRDLSSRGIDPPFPWEDLFAWRGHYKQHITGYKPRAAHIRDLAAPAREALRLEIEGVQVSDGGASDDEMWAALDARVEGVAKELSSSATLDDLQDVGRRCREILIAAAKLLADPSLVPEGVEAPKAADAKAWLTFFIRAKAPGSSHEALRLFIPVAWDLAQKVTHGSISRVDAYAAAQATVLIVRTLQQLASA